jgi:PAS domain S-box-containing protein
LKQAADKVKTALPSELAKSAEKLTVSFLRPGVSNEINISDGLRKNIADLLDAGIKDNQSHKKLIEMLERAQNETLVLMAMGSFPRFLESDDYKQYLERKANGETGAVEIRGPTNTAVANGQLSVLDAKFTEILDKRVVERALSAGSWLSGLLASVENLPVCVSLSTARKTRLGFPLIYVNKYFEDTTGYSQSEIIGQNCRFLQKGKRDNDRSEQDSIDRLTKALRSATPVKVAITNYKKSGVAFRNLLAMKPIFDFNGNYSYVVGVQFDVTSPDASAGTVLYPVPTIVHSYFLNSLRSRMILIHLSFQRLSFFYSIFRTSG